MTQRILFILLLVFAVLATGCAKGGDKESAASNADYSRNDDYGGKSYNQAAAYEPEPEEDSAYGGEAADAPTLARFAATPTPQLAPAKPPMDGTEAPPAERKTARMIIYRAWLRLASHQVDTTLAEARAITLSAGGYIESSTTTQLVLRVPADAYDETYALIRKLADIKHERVTSQDITEQFTNLAARAENLEALKTRYEALLAQAKTMEERLQIERELLRISQELSALRDRLAYLSDQAAFATITLDVERIQPKHISRNRPAQPFGWVHDHGLASLFDGARR